MGATTNIKRAALILLVFTSLLNLRSLGAFFVGDDYDTFRVLGELEGIRNVLGVTFWGEWEPVWYLSWYIDQAIWGFNPVGFHLTNLLFLGVVVVAIHQLVHALMPETPSMAWVAALLFATHPIHDEAVTYLAGRGHLIALAFSLLGLVAYISRLRPVVRYTLVSVTLVLAFLAKEWALIVPVWLGALEWVISSRDSEQRGIVLRVLRTMAIYWIPLAAAILLRHFVVGLASGHLETLLDSPSALTTRFTDAIPVYALLGGLPLPFAFLDYAVLADWQVLGWLLLSGTVLGWLAVLITSRRRKQHTSTAWRLVGFGLVIIITSMLPFLLADLSIRRRYLFAATLGSVIITSVILRWLIERLPRAGWLLTVLLIAGCSLGTIQRNELYRSSGAVARDLLEAVRGAPMNQPASWPADRPPKVALVTLPRFYGGDFVSGAYLFHFTDLTNALIVIGAEQDQVDYALACSHAGDYTAAVTPIDETAFALTVSFEHSRSFREASNSSLTSGHGDGLRAELERIDSAALRLHYRVTLHPRLQTAEPTEIYLYSDESFQRLAFLEEDLD